MSNIQISMEGPESKTVHNMGTRDRHILELESQLLRVDYEYGVIVRDLKQKHQKIGQDLSLTHHSLREVRRENKKLRAIINEKQNQLEQIHMDIEDKVTKQTFNAQSLRSLKQQNETLRNQIRHLEANASKNRMKVGEALKKKDIYKEQVVILKEKIINLQRQVKKSQVKIKQLQQLVQQEVLQTQKRIQGIGFQFCTSSSLKQVEVKIPEKQNQTVIEQNHIQLLNDWQLDMRKLKNCVDYGNQYILVFDPMNLDRSTSREIFQFLRKCLKQISEQAAQIQTLKQQHANLLKIHKQKLEEFEDQIETIRGEARTVAKIDTQMQTETINFDSQKALFQLSQLNMKLKLKNAGLIQCVDILALRNIAVMSMLQNSYAMNQYLKKQAKQQAQRTVDQKPIAKLRKACYAVIFVQLLAKKASASAKLQICTSKKTVRDRKITDLVTDFQKECQQNTELQKLKDTVTIEDTKLKVMTEQIVEYYQYKLQRYLKEQSVWLPK